MVFSRLTIIGSSLRLHRLIMSQHFVLFTRWMQIRRIELKTADGLSPLPMSSAWVRDGLFLVNVLLHFLYSCYQRWFVTSSSFKNCTCTAQTKHRPRLQSSMDKVTKRQHRKIQTDPHCFQIVTLCFTFSRLAWTVNSRCTLNGAAAKKRLAATQTPGRRPMEWILSTIDIYQKRIYSTWHRYVLNNRDH